MAEDVMTDRQEHSQPTQPPEVARGDRAVGADGHSGTLFWLRRFKIGEHGPDWWLPYGDLMSLLLAVFIMIAAMGELDNGPRFAEVASGMQNAFGFSAMQKAQRERAQALGAPLSLLERLEKVDRREWVSLHMRDGTGRPVVPCELHSRPGRLALRLPEQACFKPGSKTATPEARRLFALLADDLKDGRAILEIRTGMNRASCPDGMMLRDGCDLAYERARTCAQALIRGGVEEGRLRLRVSGPIRTDAGSTPGSKRGALASTTSDPEINPPKDDPSKVGPRGAYMEIVVCTDPSALDVKPFAEKERNHHGR
jgi:flagellar motor protein MotB